MISLCCCCKTGAYVPRWKNITEVRTQPNCADPTTITSSIADGFSIPAARLDLTYDAIGNGGPGTCTGSVACGLCGGWLVGGDLSGLSAQEVTPGIDDIMSGSIPDITHYTIDHNSYQSYPSASASFFQVGDIAKIVTLGSTDWNEMAGTTGSVYKVGDILTTLYTGSGDGSAQLVRDMVMDQRRGGQWIFAQKYWHGTPPWTDLDVCAATASNTPSQTRYLTVTVDATLNWGEGWIYGAYNTGADTATGSVTVDASSGIKTSSLLTTENWTQQEHWTLDGGVTFNHSPIYNIRSISGGAGTDSDIGGNYIDGWTNTTVHNWSNGATTDIDAICVADVHCTDIPCCGITHVGFESQNISSIIGTWNDSIEFWVANPEYGMEYTLSDLLPEITSSNSYTGSYAKTFSNGDTESLSIEWERTDTVYSWAVAYTYTPVDGEASENLTKTYSFSGSLTLSNPYTAADLEADFEAALNGWDMSDFNLASLRLDENLAHSALCTYDEVQSSVSPIMAYTPLMEDYSLPQVSGAWQYTAWLDPNSYYWVSTAGVGQAMNTAGGNVLKTPMFSGAIIAHTAPLIAGKAVGSPDRHFWFNAVTYRREENCPGGMCDGTYFWNPYSHGAYSDSQLPTPTMRWLPGYLEQYDSWFHVAVGKTPANGTFGQQFTDFPSVDSVAPQGLLVGGKYCQAVQKWNAVDYLQPSGIRKFDVDQTTVCGILAGAAPIFTICQTGYFNGEGFTAKAPLASGGLQIGDYIFIEGSGSYQVSNIVTTTPELSGRPNWIITVGSLLDGLPTGWTINDPPRDSAVHLGRLRWLNYNQYSQTFSSAPGIRGKVAINTQYTGSTLIINTLSPQPYFRIDLASSSLRPVNLYDFSGATLNSSSIVLDRITDSQFTASTINYPTAKWMVDAGLTWDEANISNTSKQTGVHITWGFDQRAANLTASAQPAWIGGSGAGTGTGVIGCLDADYIIEQFNYANNYSCAPIVGIVPTGSSENFTPPPQNIFGFPSVPIDGIYGAHSQSFIALTMIDPLDQIPYVPDVDQTTIGLNWLEDDGSGLEDTPDTTPPVAYYSYRPVVEATTTVPSGSCLPSGSLLYYDTINHHTPPNYPYGIPLGSNVVTDWGFTGRACATILASGRFYKDYQGFVSC